MTQEPFHLDDETLQAHLEGDLDERALQIAAAHLGTCPECATRSDEWAMLLRELSEIPLLEAPEGLGERIFGKGPFPHPTPSLAEGSLLERFRRVLPAPWARSHGHVRPRAIQDALDGLAGSAARSRLQAHSAACSACRNELTAWKRTYAALAGLGHFAPSADFHVRVLDHLRAFAAAPFPARTVAWSDRWLDAVRGVIPSSRRGWAVVTALVAAPAFGILAFIAVLLLHPLLTPADLFAFASWRVEGILRLASASVMQQVGGGSVPFVEKGPLGAVLASPGLTTIGLGSVWALVSAAGWIFYVHVLAPAFPTSRHAHASS